jgi:predicted nucleic acid-binding protein
MSLEQTLQTEINESKKWLDRENEETTYKRDLEKRIELINWVLENMKNPKVQICNLIENKMNEIIPIVNQTSSIIEADKLHSELRILDWILYQVCINQK